MHRLPIARLELTYINAHLPEGEQITIHDLMPDLPEPTESLEPTETDLTKQVFSLMDRIRRMREKK